MKRILIAAAAALLCACAGSRTTLDLKELGSPEEVAARALLGHEKVVALVGEDGRIVERTGSGLMASGVPLLQDTRLPGTSRESRSGEYRVVGSHGEAFVNLTAERRNNGRWRVAKWSAIGPEEHARRIAEGTMPPP